MCDKSVAGHVLAVLARDLGKFIVPDKRHQAEPDTILIERLEQELLAFAQCAEVERCLLLILGHAGLFADVDWEQGRYLGPEPAFGHDLDLILSRSFEKTELSDKFS